MSLEIENSDERFRIGGAAGTFKGFTHTWVNVERLKIDDELHQVHVFYIQ